MEIYEKLPKANSCVKNFHKTFKQLPQCPGQLPLSGRPMQELGASPGSELRREY